MVVIAPSFKIEEFLDKMIISLKNCRVEQNNHSFLANWSDWGLRLEADVSVHLFLDCTFPRRLLDGLRPPSTSLILSLRLTMPAGPLSECWCSLPLTVTTSIGIWHGAGATKSRLFSAILKKSFALIKKVSTQPKFFIRMIRETLRNDSETRMGNTRRWILMTDRYGAGTCEFYLTKAFFVSRFSSVVERWLWSLSILR